MPSIKKSRRNDESAASASAPQTQSSVTNLSKARKRQDFDNLASLLLDQYRATQSEARSESTDEANDVTVTSVSTDTNTLAETYVKQ